jgi:hypothetical protein
MALHCYPLILLLSTLPPHHHGFLPQNWQNIWLQLNDLSRSKARHEVLYRDVFALPPVANAPLLTLGKGQNQSISETVRSLEWNCMVGSGNLMISAMPVLSNTGGRIAASRRLAGTLRSRTRPGTWKDQVRDEGVVLAHWSSSQSLNRKCFSGQALKYFRVEGSIELHGAEG